MIVKILLESEHVNTINIFSYVHEGLNVSLIYPSLAVDCGRLRTSGTHFKKDGHRVFLSGVNQAWVHYGHDFGNNKYQGVAATYERYLSELEAAGGNSMSKF